MPSTPVQANGAIRMGQLTNVSSLQANDTVVVSIFSSSADGQTRAATLSVLADALPVTKVEAGTFSNSTANTTVPQGRLFYDAGFLYVSTANGVVKRVGVSTF